MRVLGADVYCHDGSACLVENGGILTAISEERLSRSKHCRGFRGAVAYCLEANGISIEDVDLLCLSHPYLTYEEAYGKYSMFDLAGRTFVLGRDLAFVDHYTCHASSAFYTSGFEEALVFVIDGHGSDGTELVTQGFYRANRTGLERLYTRSNQIASLDVGFVYESLSYHLGFENEEFDAGKTMGLSAYGDPRGPREPLYWISSGHIHANPHYIRYGDVIRRTTRHVRNLAPRRDPSQPIEQIHKDIAAFLQRESEQIIIQKVYDILRQHPSRRLCIAGGVAMNGLITNKLRTELTLDGVFVPPMPNDAGTAVGAALWGYATSAHGQKEALEQVNTSAWGQCYDTASLPGLLRREFTSLECSSYTDEAIFLESVVKALIAGAVVGWVQGGAEFGPRALGHRSILGDPRSADMKECVNARVKKREAFRPFAPAVLAEHAHKYFRFEGPSPFMSFIAPVRERGRSALPAVVHEDGTARLQTVHERTDGVFYRLIKAFHHATGVPVLLNTSFNLAGEPIVETPADALDTFTRSGMNMLAIDKHLVSKRDISTS